MNKEEPIMNRHKETKENISKTELKNFLSKAKKEAKKNNISYSMRVTNYTNRNLHNYSYGIR